MAEVGVRQHFSYTTYEDGLERSKVNKQTTCLRKQEIKVNQWFSKSDLIFRPSGISSGAQRKIAREVFGACVPPQATPMSSLPMCTHMCPPMSPNVEPAHWIQIHLMKGCLQAPKLLQILFKYAARYVQETYLVLWWSRRLQHELCSIGRLRMTPMLGERKVGKEVRKHTVSDGPFKQVRPKVEHGAFQETTGQWECWKLCNKQ